MKQLSLLVFTLVITIQSTRAQVFPCGAYISRQVPNAAGTGFDTRIDSIRVENGQSVLTQKLLLNGTLINSIGYYNGYIWAWKQFQGDQQSGPGGQALLKIGRTGQLASYSFPSLDKTYNAAAIDNAGIYYQVEYPATGATSFTLNRINITTTPPVQLTGVNINLPAGVKWPAEVSGDMIFAGSRLYLYLNQRGLLKIDLDAGTSQRLYVTGSDTSRIIGSLFTDTCDVLNVFGYGSDAYMGTGQNSNPMRNVLALSLTTGAVQTITAGGVQTTQADGASCITGSMFTLALKGRCFNDRNGNTLIEAADNGISGQGGNGASCSTCPALPGTYVCLTADTVISCVPVNQDGSYTFYNVPVSRAGLHVQLSNTLYQPGQTAAAYTAANGWAVTGENSSGDNTGNGDGNPDSKINLPVTPVRGIINGQNFGLERLPDTDNKTKLFGSIQVNSSYSLADMPLSGADPEDSPAQGSISAGGKFIITSLPPQAQAVLYYNGVAITTLPAGGYEISNYSPALLAVRFGNGMTAAGTTFNYATCDNAGQKDPSPATYSLFASVIILAADGVTLKAVKTNGDVQLQWTVPAGDNSGSFVVERGVGGSGFTAIGTVQATGNSNTVQSYNYTDMNIPRKTAYYRIRMTGSGNNSLSNTVTIQPGWQADHTLVFPNPATGTVSIRPSVEGGCLLTFINPDRSIALQRRIPSGTTEISIGISSLPAGAYLLAITPDKKGKTEYQQLVIR